MKAFCSILAVTAGVMLLAGCNNNSSGNSSATTSTNPADIDNPLVNAKRTADKTIDVTALNSEVQLFNVQEGRYPKTLDELTPKYIGQLPTPPLGYKLNYDATKGEVTVVRE